MRHTVLLLLIVAAAASAAPLAPTTAATAGRTSRPPTIDGVLDETCWQPATSAVLTGFVKPDMTAAANVETVAHLCYDDRALYLGIVCHEPEIDKIRQFCTRRDEAVWRDDCIEVFLDTNRDRTTFSQIIVNARGTLYDARTPGDSSWNAEISAVAVVGEGRWTVELAIPFADLETVPAEGDVWGFNIGRERCPGQERLSIWSPTYGKFLEPDRFGDLTFSATPSNVSWRPVAPPAFGPGGIAMQCNRSQEPALRIIDDWPAELPRDWEMPPAAVAATGPAQAVFGPGGRAWTATYRLVDGSEVALVIEQKADELTLFRQALPICLEPAPQTAHLAAHLLALAPRAEGTDPFSAEIRQMLGTARRNLDDFVQGNLARSDPMPAQEWRAAAAVQTKLAREIAGLAYVVWSKSPLEGVERREMPPALRPDPTLDLTAFGNEKEAGTFLVTNLSGSALEGRLTVSPLSLIASDRLETQPSGGIVVNGDFSADDNGDGLPDGWRRTGGDAGAGLEIDAEGRRAFVMRAAPGAAGSCVFRQRVPLTPGKAYTFVADVATENLPADAGSAHVINNGWTWSSSLAAGTATRRRSLVASFTAPAAESFEVVLRLDTPSGGALKVYSVSLTEGSQAGRRFDADCIALHDVLYQELAGGKTVADPLPLMNEARSFAIPPGETREFWLSLDTQSLPPGRYTAAVTVAPFARDLAARTVPLQIQVLPVRLPDHLPIAAFNWDYARNEHYVADLADHLTNSFLIDTSCRANFDADGELQGPVDWSGYDKMLQVKLRYARRCGGIVLFSYGIIRDFHTKYSARHGWEFMSEPWQKAFGTWVREFDRHLRDDIGMDYSEYAVQLWDEATEQNAELTLQAGLYLRSLAPEMRTCMDGAQSVAEVRALDPVIDLWIPHQTTLYSSAEREELRALYRELGARGEPVWTYTCSTFMKALDPLDYYRLKEWRVWDLGLEGTCYWAYNSWRGDPWNDFDGEIADCGAIYDGPDRPITSRRWEQTREGREDYMLLHMLGQSTEKLDEPVARDVEEFITNLVTDVLDNPRDTAGFAARRQSLCAAVAWSREADRPKLTSAPALEQGEEGLSCTWATDRPAAGRLLYRVPGDAEWTVVDVPADTEHEVRLGAVPAKRAVEWYLLYWSESGALNAAFHDAPAR